MVRIYLSDEPTTVVGLNPIPLNTWSHLAATYDGQTLRLYVNGVQVGSAAANGTVRKTTYPLFIGRESLYDNHFAGTLDEVQIYDHALTTAEIQQAKDAALPAAIVPSCQDDSNEPNDSPAQAKEAALTQPQTVLSLIHI